MNRTLGIVALLVASSLLAIPNTAAQAGGFCANQGAPESVVFCDDFQTDQGWTPFANEHNLPNQAWHQTTNGNGDAHAWYAGIQLASAEQGSIDVGYGPTADQVDNNEAVITLTSPMIDATDKTLATLEFAIRGGSEGGGYDSLFIETKAAGATSWTRHLTHSGSATETINSPFSTIVLDASSLSEQSFQLRFYFYSDANSDTSTGNGFGFWIDDVAVYEFIPEDPVEPPEPAPGDPGNIPPTLESFDIAPATVDIIQGGSTTFTASTQDDRRVVVTAVFLERRGSNPVDQFSVTMTQQSSETGTVDFEQVTNQTWSATIQHTDSKLSVGTWDVVGIAYDQDGGIASTSGADVDDELEVTAVGSSTAPTARLSGFTSNPPQQVLGVGDSLRFVIGGDLVSRVTYQLAFPGGAVGPVLQLNSPYILRVDSFPDGEQTVIVTAHDRAHRTASVQVPVLADAQAPTVSLAWPANVYEDIPFAVTVQVKDKLASTHTMTVDGSTFPLTRAAGTTTGDLGVVIPNIGGKAWSFTSTDAIGNTVTTTGSITVKSVFTETTIVDLEQTSEPALPGDAVAFKATVEQVDGVTTIPVNVTFSGPRVEQTQSLQVGNGSTESATFQHVFRPGQHQLEASIFIEPTIEQRGSSNQSITIDFEVFLGKVTTSTETYYIRTMDGVRASHAVGEDGETYALTLLQESGQTLYRFEVDGQELHWDPLTRETVVPTDGEGEGEAKPTPGLGLVVVLAGIAVALAARRR